MHQIRERARRAATEQRRAAATEAATIDAAGSEHGFMRPPTPGSSPPSPP
jgi:hypothetical protein